MKTKMMSRYFILPTVILLIMGGEWYRQTTADLYEQSYAAQMSKGMGYSSVNDIRADRYREMYSRYDENHNLVKPARPSQKETGDGEKAKKNSEESKPFFHVPVYQ